MQIREKKQNLLSQKLQNNFHLAVRLGVKDELIEKYAGNLDTLAEVDVQKYYEQKMRKISESDLLGNLGAIRESTFQEVVTQPAITRKTTDITTTAEPIEVPEIETPKTVVTKSKSEKPNSGNSNARRSADPNIAVGICRVKMLNGNSCHNVANSLTELVNNIYPDYIRNRRDHNPTQQVVRADQREYQQLSAEISQLKRLTINNERLITDVRNNLNNNINYECHRIIAEMKRREQEEDRNSGEKSKIEAKISHLYKMVRDLKDRIIPDVRYEIQYRERDFQDQIRRLENDIEALRRYISNVFSSRNLEKLDRFKLPEKTEIETTKAPVSPEPPVQEYLEQEIESSENQVERTLPLKQEPEEPESSEVSQNEVPTPTKPTTEQPEDFKTVERVTTISLPKPVPPSKNTVPTLRQDKINIDLSNIMDCQELNTQILPEIIDTEFFMVDSKKMLCRYDKTTGKLYTVIQRRTNNFSRENNRYSNWKNDPKFYNRTFYEYKKGFGTINSWWYGLEKMQSMTDHQLKYKLRIEFQDWISDGIFWIEYDHFRIGTASTDFKLTLGKSHGIVEDSMFELNNGQPFSAFDFSQDGTPEKPSCSQIHANTGWWFNKNADGEDECSYANLNGRYHDLTDTIGWVDFEKFGRKQGIYWVAGSVGGDIVSLKNAWMGIYR